MFPTNYDQTGSINQVSGDTAEPGFLHIAEEGAQSSFDTSVSAQSTSSAKPTTSLAAHNYTQAGSIEHLAVRGHFPALASDTPVIKQRLSELRSAITRLLTGLRWEDQSVEDTSEQLIPLLNVGSLPQWQPILIPFLYEIDRAGALLPVWLNIIARGDPTNLPPDANPAETAMGRARRIAILMLGNYRMLGITQLAPKLHKDDHDPDLTQTLAALASDPNSSLYATQALVKHATVPAMQALISALKSSQGWAKVDVIEGCLALNQERFYPLLLTSGLNDLAGLESYVAIPLYRKIPLEKYLHPASGSHPRLLQSAALIFRQILQESMNIPAADQKTRPVVFERPLPTLASALFEGASSYPMWQNTLAVHRLGIFLGRYWSEITRNTIKDAQIIEPIYHCLPMMNDIEHWMAGPGRDVLLEALPHSADETLLPIVKVLGELREPRTSAPLVARIENLAELKDRQQALNIGAICETLGILGDRRTLVPMLQMLYRTVDVAQRTHEPKRAANLSDGDSNIPGSIVYAAVVRACGQLGDRYALEGALRATNDVDPYVRTQALQALRRLDANADDPRTRQAAREALNDPGETVVRTACRFVVQYQDSEALTPLQRLIDKHPEFASFGYEALRQLGTPRIF